MLAAIVASFHAALWALGVSLQQAQEAGWVLKPAVRVLGGGQGRRGLASRPSLSAVSTGQPWPVCRPLLVCPQASTGNPLDLWRLFDLPLSNLHLPAALAQVGKVRRRPLGAAGHDVPCVPAAPTAPPPVLCHSSPLPPASALPPRSWQGCSCS